MIFLKKCNVDKKKDSLLNFLLFILAVFIFNETNNSIKTFLSKKKDNQQSHLFSSFYSLETQTDTIPTVYNFDYDDERRALREELERFRQDNESLRQSIRLNSKRAHGAEHEKLTTKTPSTVGHNIRTTTTSVNSTLDTTTPGMSSTYLSSSALQLELNESRERERKLEEKINLLRKVRKKQKRNKFIFTF